MTQLAFDLTVTPPVRQRSGFPHRCPITGQAPTGAHCLGRRCEHYRQDGHGAWRCTHPAFQQAPGVHWCPDCGIELGPWAEAHGWTHCGGPTGRCRKNDEGFDEQARQLSAGADKVEVSTTVDTEKAA